MPYKKEFSSYYDLVGHLKKNLPLRKNVIVRRRKMPLNTDGDCEMKNGNFFIRIDNKLSPAMAIETVIHEFGHCLSYNKDEDDHGIEWGKSYSVVYQEFLRWVEKD